MNKADSVVSYSNCVHFVQVSGVHKDQCVSLAVSQDGRYLLTAGHNAVKVWDYNMSLDINSQVGYF